MILAFGMLIIATGFDLWKRSIHDLLWVAFAAIAIGLVFLEPNLQGIMLEILVSLIIAPIAILLWRVGMFGGADAFALIVLAALAPQLSLSESAVTPLTTLTNAALLSTIILLINAIRNGVYLACHKNIFEGFEESRLKKTCAIFLGYRAKNPKFGFAIERLDGKSKKLDFTFHHAEHAEYCTTSDTWITPAIPFILYITGGFVIQLFFGDIVVNFIMRFMIFS